MSPTGAAIMSVFAAVWWIAGARTSGHGSRLMTLVPLFVTGAILGVAVRRMRQPDRTSPAEHSRQGRLVGWASAAEGVAILVTVNVLANVGQQAWAVPSIAIIVGLHFFPLARIVVGDAAAISASSADVRLPSPHAQGQLMRMPAFDAPVTADQLAEFPDDGRRYEVIDGVLFVTPAPARTHQRAQMQLAMRLFAYAESLGLEVLAAPTAVRASELTEVQPDLIVLPRQAIGRDDTPYERLSQLVLAIEILSPSSVRTDRGVKRQLYVDSGVPEYWIVDTNARRVERWRAGAANAEHCAELLVWEPVAGREALVIDLKEYFAAVIDA